MEPRYRLWHGRAEPPDPGRQLRAGPLTALLDGVDLRYVRVGGHELVRRIHVAVRDRNWATVPGEVTGVEVEQDEEGWAVSFAVRHRAGDLAFAWQGRIEGRPDGLLSRWRRGRRGLRLQPHRHLRAAPAARDRGPAVPQRDAGGPGRGRAAAADRAAVDRRRHHLPAVPLVQRPRRRGRRGRDAALPLRGRPVRDGGPSATGPTARSRRTPRRSRRASHTPRRRGRRWPSGSSSPSRAAPVRPRRPTRRGCRCAWASGSAARCQPSGWAAPATGSRCPSGRRPCCGCCSRTTCAPRCGRAGRAGRRRWPPRWRRRARSRRPWSWWSSWGPTRQGSSTRWPGACAAPRWPACSCSRRTAR